MKLSLSQWYPGAGVSIPDLCPLSYFHMNDPLLVPFLSCSKKSILYRILVAMQPKGKTLLIFLSKINGQNLKIIRYKCFLVNSLPRLFKSFNQSKDMPPLQGLVSLFPSGYIAEIKIIFL